MLHAQLRAVLIAIGLVAAGLALWALLAPDRHEISSQPPPASRSTPADTVAALDSLSPPDDLAAVRHVAERFAVALYRSDLPTLRRLVTPPLAEQLELDGPTQTLRATGAVTIDGVVTEDLRPDQVLLQVVVRREDAAGQEQLEGVTLALTGMAEGWRVSDVAF